MNLYALVLYIHSKMLKITNGIPGTMIDTEYLKTKKTWSLLSRSLQSSLGVNWGAIRNVQCSVMNAFCVRHCAGHQEYTWMRGCSFPCAAHTELSQWMEHPVQAKRIREGRNEFKLRSGQRFHAGYGVWH